MPIIEAESTIPVAVGAIVNASGQVLLAQRAAHQHQGGLFEFPGGKIEQGETVEAALERELFEELGIRVEQSRPLITITHDYADRRVCLYVRKVLKYAGEEQSKEHQPLKWVDIQRLKHVPLPAANCAIVASLMLPTRIAVCGGFDDLSDFQHRFSRAINRGAQLVYLRSRLMPQGKIQEIVEVAEMESLARDVPLMLNLDVLQYARRPSYCQLRSTELARAQEARDFGVQWVGASCHSRKDLLAAKKAGVDFAFLSPIFNTPKHDGIQPWGIEGLAALSQDLGIPIFGLGGVLPKHESAVHALGIQGIASSSGYWQ